MDLNKCHMLHIFTLYLATFHKQKSSKLFILTLYCLKSSKIVQYMSLIDLKEVEGVLEWFRPFLTPFEVFFFFHFCRKVPGCNRIRWTMWSHCALNQVSNEFASLQLLLILWSSTIFLTPISTMVVTNKDFSLHPTTLDL